MLSFLLAVHFVLTIAIIGLILLQKHDSDGALGSSGGGAASGMFTVRGQANLLTRATAILMAIFITNCIVMAKVAKNTSKKESIIDSVAQKTAQQHAQIPQEPLKPSQKDPQKTNPANQEKETKGNNGSTKK